MPLEYQEGIVSTGGRTITSLRFPGDIDGLAGEEEELAKVVARLEKASTAYGMEISTGKTKLMTNNTSGARNQLGLLGSDLHVVGCAGFVETLS